jgi:hypothetical protein
MVTIQEATQNAMAFAAAALGPERTQGLRLEEVESSTENGVSVWYITLSMVDREQGTSAMGSAFAALVSPKREYKRFTIVKETGDVTAMHIREVANI